MKRLLAAVLSLLLCYGFAAAEVVPVEAVDVEAIPQETRFETDAFALTLPAGLEPLREEARRGYDAALREAFPAVSAPVLMAVNEDHSAVVCASVLPSEKTALEAARAASERILNKSDNVVETSCADQPCACFACLIGGATYNIYILKSGESLVALGISGIGDDATAEVLASLSLSA